MNDIAEQAADIYRRRVLEARRTPPEERFWDGPRLFEMGCRIMRAGIEAQVGPDPEKIEIEFKRRMAIAERLQRFSGR